MKHIESQLSSAFVNLEVLNYNISVLSSDSSNDIVNKTKDNIQPLVQIVVKLKPLLEAAEQSYRDIFQNISNGTGVSMEEQSAVLPNIVEITKVIETLSDILDTYPLDLTSVRELKRRVDALQPSAEEMADKIKQGLD